MPLPQEITDYLAKVAEEMVPAKEEPAASETEQTETEVVSEVQAEPEATEPEQVTADDTNSGVEASTPTPDAAQESVVDTTPAVDPQVVEAARAFGFSAEEVSAFNSVEDFNKAISLLQTLAVKQGGRVAAQRQQRADAQIPAQQPPPQQTQQQPPPQAPPAQAEPSSPLDALQGALDKIVSDPDFNEDIVSVLKATAEAVKSTASRNKELENSLQAVNQQLQQAREAQQQARAKQEVDEFERNVEVLNRPDLFGVGDQRTPEQIENLTKLYQLLNVIRTGLNVIGLPPVIDKSSVTTAFASAFPGHIKKQAAVQQAQKLKDQSKQRMGTGQPRTTPAREIPFKGPLDGQSLSKHPVLKEFFEKHGMTV